MKQQKLILNCFVFSLMFLLIGPSLIKKGLFMDGEIYSAIAHNLHIGKGSFWFPHWTGNIYTPFHQHPPLAFGLQSLYYKVFGSSLYVDRIFSFSMACFAFLMIGQIWKMFQKDLSDRLNFLPRLFWITVPVVFWCYMNNMLENLVTLTCLIAVYSLLRASRTDLKKAIPWYLLAGLFLIAGFLTKGPVALFPLGVPFLIGIVKKQYVEAIKQTALLMLALALAGLIIVVMFPDSRPSIETYIQNQLQPSLKGEAVVVRRTYILERLFMEILPMLGFFLVYFLLRIKQWSKIPPEHKRSALLFLLIGLSASLPIMVSPKQLMFYIAPSMPYFAIAVSFLMAKQVSQDLQLMSERRLWKPVLLSLTGVVLVLGIVLTVKNDGTYKRNGDMVGDYEVIGAELPVDTEVSVSNSLGRKWLMFAYLPRYYQLEMFRSDNSKPFMIQMKGDPMPEGYELLSLKTEKLQLLKKVE